MEISRNEMEIKAMKHEFYPRNHFKFLFLSSPSMLFITSELWRVENVRTYEQVAVWQRSIFVHNVEEHRV